MDESTKAGQTALKPGDIEPDKLRNNLHAILTISDQFLPHAHLRQATDRLYADAAASAIPSGSAPVTVP